MGIPTAIGQKLRAELVYIRVDWTDVPPAWRYNRNNRAELLKLFLRRFLLRILF